MGIQQTIFMRIKKYCQYCKKKTKRDILGDCLGCLERVQLYNAEKEIFGDRGRDK